MYSPIFNLMYKLLFKIFLNFQFVYCEAKGTAEICLISTPWLAVMRYFLSKEELLYLTRSLEVLIFSRKLTVSSFVQKLKRSMKGRLYAKFEKIKTASN